MRTCFVKGFFRWLSNRVFGFKLQNCRLSSRFTHKLFPLSMNDRQTSRHISKDSRCNNSKVAEILVNHWFFHFIFIFCEFHFFNFSSFRIYRRLNWKLRARINNLFLRKVLLKLTQPFILTEHTSETSNMKRAPASNNLKYLRSQGSHAQFRLEIPKVWIVSVTWKISVICKDITNSGYSTKVRTIDHI